MRLRIHLSEWVIKPENRLEYKYVETRGENIVLAMYHSPKKYKAYSFLCFTLLLDNE